MKKLMILMLLLGSTNTIAEWTYLDKNTSGGYKTYVNLKSLIKNGNKVKMWRLNDFKSIQIFPDDNTKYLSSISRDEYDCVEETLRKLDFFWYSENMGHGQVVYSSDHSILWQMNNVVVITPGHIHEGLLKIACGQ